MMGEGNLIMLGSNIGESNWGFCNHGYIMASTAPVTQGAIEKAGAVFGVWLTLALSFPLVRTVDHPIIPGTARTCRQGPQMSVIMDRKC
jgi:hypothetical protein